MVSEEKSIDIYELNRKTERILTNNFQYSPHSQYDGSFLNEGNSRSVEIEDKSKLVRGTEKWVLEPHIEEWKDS